MVSPIIREKSYVAPILKSTKAGRLLAVYQAVIRMSKMTGNVASHFAAILSCKAIATGCRLQIRGKHACPQPLCRDSNHQPTHTQNTTLAADD
jgi:hypothetical protein